MLACRRRNSLVMRRLPFVKNERRETNRKSGLLGTTQIDTNGLNFFLIWLNQKLHELKKNTQQSLKIGKHILSVAVNIN